MLLTSFLGIFNTPKTENLALSNISLNEYSVYQGGEAFTVGVIPPTSVTGGLGTLPVSSKSLAVAFSVPLILELDINRLSSIVVEYEACDLFIIGCLIKSDKITVERSVDEITQGNASYGFNYISYGINALGTIQTLLDKENQYEGWYVISEAVEQDILSNNYKYYFTIDEKRTTYIKTIMLKYYSVTGDFIEQPIETIIQDDKTIPDWIKIINDWIRQNYKVIIGVLVLFFILKFLGLIKPGLDLFKKINKKEIPEYKFSQKHYYRRRKYK
jgi:hypothetical protein